MDTSSVLRVPAPPATPAPRIDAPRPAEAAALDLAVAPAVEVQVSSAAKRQMKRTELPQQVGTPPDESAYVDEPRANGLVFRVSDGSSGSIVFQIPSEEALKLRAYAEQAERAREERANETDVTA